MQYILTQEELDALRQQNRSIKLENTRKLQKLCTKIACEMPITRSWRKGEPPTPWGCMLAKDDNHTPYCDECPVKEICPYNGKEHSQ